MSPNQARFPGRRPWALMGSLGLCGMVCREREISHRKDSAACKENAENTQKV